MMKSKCIGRQAAAMTSLADTCGARPPALLDDSETPPLPVVAALLDARAIAISSS